MEWNPARVSHADAVARLFPDLPRDIRMERGVPGRSWPVDATPSLKTKLDDKIIELRDGLTPRKRIRRPEVLAEGGVTSVLYAARVHTLIAWSNANADALAHSRTRFESLERERDAFTRRIGSTRAILACDPDCAVRSGNPYLDLIYPERDAADRETGRAHYAAMSAELSRDEGRLAQIQGELDRLADNDGPKVWDVSFFLRMGNLWNLLTGELPAVNRGGPFTQLLDAAVGVLRGDARAEDRPWGVAKELLTRFKGAGPGEGFRTGETGEMSLDSIHQIASRGPDARVFLEVAGDDMGATAAAVIALRDYSDRPDETIVREMVLRPPFKWRDLLTPIVRAQLGWLYAVDAKGIRSAARSTIEAARDGDARAVAAVELARRAQTLAMGRQTEWGERYDIAWPKPFSGLDPRDVRRVLLARAGDDLFSCALLDWPGLWPAGSRLPHEGSAGEGC